MTTEQNKTEQQTERDPILDKTVSITMKVEELNVILNLLGDLPFIKASAAIEFLRGKAMAELKAQEPAPDAE